MGSSFVRSCDLGAGPIAFGFRRSRLTNAGPAEDFAIRVFP